MFGVALLTSTLLALANARIYERCELARDLLSLGIKKEHLATWVCIAYHESRFDTAARNPSSGDHGLLQISEIYWCGAGKVCGLPCSALRDEDISDDVECAQQIYEEHTRLQGNGFLAWVVYPQHCKHNAKKYLADCESSVKSSSVRTDGRARVFKSRTRNFTNTLSQNINIDKLLPPYLTVGALLRGKYEKVFEENYNKHGKVDWVNYKLDSVDELKLPVFNQNVSERYTSTTSLTTTSTTPLPLPNIKPPSPRRIESNSFRRRKMRPLSEPSFKISETNEKTTTEVSTTTTRVITSTITPVNITSSTEVVLNPTTESAAPLSPSTIRPLSRNNQVLGSFTTRTTKMINDVHLDPSVIPTTTTEATTTSRILQTENLPVKDANKRLLVSKKSTNKFPESNKPTPTPVPSTLSVDKATHVDRKIQESENKTHNTNLEVTTSTLRPTFKSSVPKNTLNNSFNRLHTTSTTSRPRLRSWSAWRTSPVPQTKTSTTSRPSTGNWRTAKSYSSDTKDKVSRNVSTTMLPILSTTSKPQATQVLPKSTISADTNTTTTKVSVVQTTTIQPPTTTRPAYGRTVSESTRSPVKTSLTSTTTKKIVTSTPSPTTVRTTPSIFDLYLNPTKRPKLPTFSFAPFKSSLYSLRIFAGGTTTNSPLVVKKN